MTRTKFVWSLLFLALAFSLGMLLSPLVRAEGGSTQISDGVLLDAVAFPNGDTLSILQNGDRVEFVYLYLGGGSMRDSYRVALTPVEVGKMLVSGRYAHLIYSSGNQTYQLSFHLPGDAPYFNCPTQALPLIGN